VPTAGYGLGIMQERAKRVGATLTLITEPHSGTEVIAVWSPQPETNENNA
jgi:nitrate/nitrite-specific signal transduction histidine kinase